MFLDVVDNIFVCYNILAFRIKGVIAKF